MIIENMYIEEDNYESFKNDKINNLSNLNYNFILNQRFVSVKDENQQYFSCQTPFLKVLKTNHITFNKKKTIANKYIILETSDELDFNNQIGDFLFIINKIHEISQEKIKENSMEWFNTEFDEIGLDIKVRRPIDQQKDNEFIKIAIPKNKEIEEKINLVSKGDYILCNIKFKGLKVSNDYIIEEWELDDFVTQNQYDELQNKELLTYDVKDNELITTILEEELNNEVSVVEVINGEDENPITLLEEIQVQTIEKDSNENLSSTPEESELVNNNKEEILTELNDNVDKEVLTELNDKELILEEVKETTLLSEVLSTNNSLLSKYKNKKHKIIKKSKKILYI
jgi:hypothetical protein